jgi:iron complex transport system substrate-binding protein
VARIVSLLRAATEIAAALGLTDELVGVSHECDFPEEVNARPRVTRCPVHKAGLTSKQVDEWVKRALRENGTIYTIDEPLLRELRPDAILTQKLCDVCAVGYGTVAQLAETLPGPPRIVNLDPTSLSDILMTFVTWRMRVEFPWAPTKSSRNYLSALKRCDGGPAVFRIGRAAS